MWVVGVGLAASGLVYNRLDLRARTPRLRPLPVATDAPLLADDAETSVAAFLEEIILPEATVRTPQFEDSSSHTWLPEAEELAELLSERSAQLGRNLDGILRFGDSWYLHFLGFFVDDEAVHLTFIKLAHRRVRAKCRLELSLSEYLSFIETLRSLAVHDVDPWADSFRYNLMGASPQCITLKPSAELAAAVNLLLDGAQVTYSHGYEDSK